MDEKVSRALFPPACKSASAFSESSSRGIYYLFMVIRLEGISVLDFRSELTTKVLINYLLEQPGVGKFYVSVFLLNKSSGYSVELRNGESKLIVG